MITRDNIDRLAGIDGNVIDPDGSKIGSIGQFYLDDRTEEPNWVTVKTGLFGTSETFVPLQDATVDGDDIRVPYSKEKVKDAPRIDPDGHLEVEEEERLYSYYGVGGGTYAGTGGMIAGEDTYRDTETAGMGTGVGETYRDTDRDTDRGTGRGTDTDDAMTRSEERLRVGKESEETGRARLRKYIVTEQATTTVPVQREEVRLEREPITDANVDEAMQGPDLTESEHEVTLHAEKPVVEKETVPVERVRLEKDTVTDEERVSADVRKEEIDTEGTRDRHDEGRNI